MSTLPTGKTTQKWYAAGIKDFAQQSREILERDGVEALAEWIRNNSEKVETKEVRLAVEESDEPKGRNMKDAPLFGDYKHIHAAGCRDLSDPEPLPVFDGTKEGLLQACMTYGHELHEMVDYEGEDLDVSINTWLAPCAKKAMGL